MYSFKEYLIQELLDSDECFSWKKVFKKIKGSREADFIFWYRLAYVLYRKDNPFLKKISKKINRKIRFKYCCDIYRECNIDIGLNIVHLSGIVINPVAKIGKNFIVRQNTTIGIVDKDVDREIIIGDNVSIGANSCIIGDRLRIGNNVTIGAMSFVNEDIESNTVFYTEKRAVKKMLANCD
ncbi:serine acetyltransferase [Endozoicomonas lisbonensis]|uniref:Serine acetyltransferase n=1 Tax=Endozoicomonas lisbonensis TaxID=3120522 RepID=A0ABV2SD02_9GAMM